MEWHTINSYPDYEITKSGLIRHIKQKKIKSVYLNDAGYKMVSINRNGKSRPERVHRLLMETFVDNPDCKPHVNHKNGNKLDNSFSNLEWCTNVENNNHALALKLIDNRGEKNGQAKLTELKVKEIKTLLSEKITQQKIADKYGVSRSCILGIHLGLRWKHV